MELKRLKLKQEPATGAGGDDCSGSSWLWSKSRGLCIIHPIASDRVAVVDIDKIFQLRSYDVCSGYEVARTGIGYLVPVRRLHVTFGVSAEL